MGNYPKSMDEKVSEYPLPGAEHKNSKAGREVIADSVSPAWQEAETLRLEIERQEQGKDEFLALFAHELRGPLNAILGWVRILSKRFILRRIILFQTVVPTTENLFLKQLNKTVAIVAA
jgi:signal transduction histidine kinase